MGSAPANVGDGARGRSGRAERDASITAVNQQLNIDRDWLLHPRRGVEKAREEAHVLSVLLVQLAAWAQQIQESRELLRKVAKLVVWERYIDQCELHGAFLFIRRELTGESREDVDDSEALAYWCQRSKWRGLK